jgi:hypothetical protein
VSGSPDLERRYRRLLAFYPKAFRDEHEQEVLSVLMADAADGQRRPGIASSADLLWNAILAHLHRMRLHPSWDYRRMMQRGFAIEARHPRRSVLIRVGVGVWLLVLTGILCGYGRDVWLAALLVPAAMLHFYLAYRLRHVVRR